MKPLGYIKVILFTAVSALLAGCVQEDIPECEGRLGVRFSYTKNLEGVNKFETDVDRITLYIFDGEGYYIKSYYEEGLKPNSYVMDISGLDPGNYHMVAWSFKTDEYNLPALVPGVTNLKDIAMSFRSKNNVVVDYPYDLFYGMRRNVTVEDSGEDRVFDIDLMKDTKQVHVTMKGLPLDHAGGSGGIDGAGCDCIISSRNGIIRFSDNQPQGSLITYMPHGYLEGDDLIADFVLLRESSDGYSDSRLIITRETEQGEVELLNEALLPLLFDASETGNIDIEDYFPILVEFGISTNGNVTIVINGWIVIEGGNVTVG